MNKLKQKSIDGVIWNILEKVGIQFIKLILGVILARLLTPADYGLIGMITVFFAIAMVFIDSGFGLAYIQKQDVNETDASTIFYFNLIVSIVFYTILYYSGPLIAKFYNEVRLTNLIRVMGLILIINSFGLIQLSKLTKKVDFKFKTILVLVSSVVASLSGIIAAVSGLGVWSLVIQEIVRSTLKTLGLWIFYKWRPILEFNFQSLRSMLSFSLWALSNGIIRTVFDNIYVLAIGKFYPAAELGFYSKAKQFRGIITKTPANAVGAVAFPVLSKIQNDKLYVKKAMKNFIQYIMFLVAPLSAIFIVIANPFFKLLLTEKWLPMVPYFQLLLIAGVFYPLNMINVQALIAQGKMKLNFTVSMLKNSLRLLNIFILYDYGVINIIYGELVISLLSIVINTYYTKKYLNYGLWTQLKDISVIIISSSVSVYFAFLLKGLLINDYAKIIIVTLFILSFYLLTMRIFEKKLLKNNLDLIMNKIKGNN